MASTTALSLPTPSPILHSVYSYSSQLISSVHQDWSLEVLYVHPFCDLPIQTLMKILSERQSDVIAEKWQEEHKPTTESPNLETIVEDDLEDDSNDDVHLFLLRT